MGVPSVGQAMISRLHHRGPDRQATCVEAEGLVELGFARLAIRDLSPAGNQPMVSEDGRYVIAYNGEAYNIDALKQLVESHRLGPPNWRGTSDTEVILAAIVRIGFLATLQQLNAMLAIALWDRQDKTLMLARDRFGEKPLYYYWNGADLIFGSELSALWAHPHFRPDIDEEARALYFQRGFIPGPRSIFKRTAKLLPGHVLRIKLNTRGDLEPPKPFWDALEAAERGAGAPRAKTFEEAVELTAAAVRKSVRSRLVSDVPVGAFLSGGIDSSLIVAVMQQAGGQAARTYSVAFSEKEFDEGPNARRVAEYLGTIHREVVVEEAEALDVARLLPNIYDEPMADSSQIPTYLVSRLAGSDVKVALSGDGGDELFGGYNKYLWGAELLRLRRHLPIDLMLRMASTGLLSRVGKMLDGMPASPFLQRIPFNKLSKLKTIGAIATPADVYRGLSSYWRNPGELLTRGFCPPDGRLNDALNSKVLDQYKRWMLADVVSNLVDDILAKVDRASMAVSLEARMPLLDPELFSLAMSFPTAFNIKGGTGKRVLRAVLAQYLPADLIKGRKTGFEIPLNRWLRTGLKDWARDLVYESDLVRSGAVRREAVDAVWRDLEGGTQESAGKVWTLVVYEAWSRHIQAAARA